MSEVSEFGFDNEEIKGDRPENFKGKKGILNRIGLVFVNSSTPFSGVKMHYKERYFQCKGSICCEKLGAPRYRIGAVVIVYATDNLGNVKKEFGYEIKPWMFGDQTYSKLKNANSEFPLMSHDIKVNCTNQDYQNLDFTPCKESIWQSKDDFKKKVLAEAKPTWEYLKKNLASNLSIEEIKDLLGESTETAQDPGASSIDLENIINNV